MAAATQTNKTHNSRLVVISYNMHGYNQGCAGVLELINKIKPDVVMVQEHWLTPDNLSKLDRISNDYFVFGSSAMDDRVCAGPLYGRPFGGTAMLINKCYAPVTKTIVSCERFTAIKIYNNLLLTVYMPCMGTANRDFIYDDLLVEFDEIMTTQTDCNCLIAGDFNTNLDNNSAVSTKVNAFVEKNSLCRCDVIFPVANKHTYYNDSTNCCSTIDYMLTSCRPTTDIIAFNVLELDVNLSDHLPLMAICSVGFGDNSTINQTSTANCDVEHLRWDHAPIDKYYEQTRLFLQPVLYDLDKLIANSFSMDTDSVVCASNIIYDRLVEGLCFSANMHIPKHKKNFFKFWWSQELDMFKEKAIASCREWKSAGKPKSGPIFQQYIKDKSSYKQCIRKAQSAETTCYTNDLHEALLRKNGPDFWKVWKSKFGKTSSNIQVVDGLVDGSEIADKFARHFESNCTPFNMDRNVAFEAEYKTLRATYCGDSVDDCQWCDIELVE